VDFVEWASTGTGFSLKDILSMIGIYENKFRNWAKRYGKVNSHNGKIPRDFWIQDWEREAIIEFHSCHPLEGYRRLAYMMNDAGVVAVAPSTVYRVLKSAGLIGKSLGKPSKKGTGFHQPSAPHHHWHIDVAYINIGGTFYYLCMVLDGYSRYLVAWDLKPQMTEKDIEYIIEKGRERFPGTSPRIISDNGPQFISRDFKEYIRICSMTHVRTSPFYPQSNGKLEALNKTAKREVIRPSNPRTLAEARAQIDRWVNYYNETRLHSSIDYVTPWDKLQGREAEILRMRDERLEAARAKRVSAKTTQKEDHIEVGEKFAIPENERGTSIMLQN
jgi:transposase InsO family protein